MTLLCITFIRFPTVNQCWWSVFPGVLIDGNKEWYPLGSHSYHLLGFQPFHQMGMFVVRKSRHEHLLISWDEVNPRPSSGQRVASGKLLHYFTR